MAMAVCNENVINYSCVSEDFTVRALKQVGIVYVLRFMTNLSTMDVHVVLGLFLILDLLSHGISVPVYNFYESAPNQDYRVSDDITESYERFPRNTLPNSNLWNQYRWYPRSSIPTHPRQAFKKHFHLFHLTSEHPNAVSYHVIEKPHTASNRHKAENSNTRRSDFYNNNRGQYQNYPAQSYYQQPTYQYPGYPSTGYGFSTPQTQYGVQNGGGVHDSTYDDILDVVSKPMQIGNKIIPPYHGQDRQNDEKPNSVEEAAKQFKLASANMNNMELASLVIYPVPKFNDKPNVHKKGSKKKHQKHHDKKLEEKEDSNGKGDDKTGTDLVDHDMDEEEKNYPNVKSEDKKVSNRVDDDKYEKEKENHGVKNEDKTVNNLVDNLIKNDKEDKTHEDNKETSKIKENEEDDQRIKDKEGGKGNKKEKENDGESEHEEKEENEKSQHEGVGKKAKDNDDDDDDDDDMDGKHSKDTWAEEDASSRSGIPRASKEISNSKRSEIPHAFDGVPNSKEEDQYTSSKRSEIPRAFDEISNSDEDEDKTDKSEINDEEKSETEEAKDDSTENDEEQESENRNENDETEADSAEVETNTEKETN